MLKQIQKLLVLLALACLLGYATICAYFYTQQNQILFPATKTPADFQYSFPILFEEVFIDVEDAKLHALYFPTQLESKGMIIFFHGNSERADQFGASAHQFTTRGYDYLIPDYRGYGRSTGEITSEEQFLKDMDFIYDWAKTKYAEKDIILAGRSIGAVPAAYLASKHQPRLAVMIAAFYDVKAMKDVRYPFLPNLLIEYQFPNHQWVAEAKSPIYFVHGDEDISVPYEQSLRLAKVAAKPSEHFTVHGAGHNNLQNFQQYHEILYKILQAYEPQEITRFE